jgi:hypothetical protein
MICYAKLHADRQTVNTSRVSCTPINYELQLDTRFVTSSYSLPFANPLISKTTSSTCRCEQIDACTKPKTGFLRPDDDGYILPTNRTCGSVFPGGQAQVRPSGISALANDFGRSVAVRRPVHLVLHGLKEQLGQLGVGVIVDAGGVNVGDLLREIKGVRPL